MKMLCGKTMQMYLLVTVSVLLYSADAIGLNQDELMEEMFFGEEPLIEELQESGGPELSRNRRQTDVGSGEELSECLFRSLAGGGGGGGGRGGNNIVLTITSFTVSHHYFINTSLLLLHSNGCVEPGGPPVP